MFTLRHNININELKQTKKTRKKIEIILNLLLEFYLVYFLRLYVFGQKGKETKIYYIKKDNFKCLPHH